MTGAAWALLGAAAAFALADWVAVHRRWPRLEYLCKPATLVALIAVAIALHPEASARRAWFVAALVLSLAGDVFLMIPRGLFTAGLGSFLVAHLAYVAGLNVDGGSLAALAAAAAAVALFAVPLGRTVLAAVAAGGRSDLVAPVATYLVAISAMAASAVASGRILAAAGAVLFVVSDAVNAWTRFVRPLRRGRLAVMVTYHVGQAGLVVSLAT